jgi:hypothetical protein
MNNRAKLDAVIAAQKEGREIPAWAMLGHKKTQAREEGLKNQEPLGDHGVELEIHQGNQETKSLVATSLTARETGVVEANILIERYGDVINTIDNHPAFEIVTRPEKDGGWEIWPQALTKAVKAKSVDGDLATGLAVVLDAVRYTKAYRAARNKRAFFWSVLENGKKAKA